VTLLALSIARLSRRRKRLPPEGAAFAVFAAAAFAVHLPISAYVRMLIPMVPPMLWVIVYALDRSSSADVVRASASSTSSGGNATTVGPERLSSRS
jgi:hypothetical protein